MTQEFEAASETFVLTLEDFEKISINAMKSAFLPYDKRCEPYLQNPETGLGQNPRGQPQMIELKAAKPPGSTRPMSPALRPTQVCLGRCPPEMHIRRADGCSPCGRG